MNVSPHFQTKFMLSCSNSKSFQYGQSSFIHQFIMNQYIYCNHYYFKGIKLKIFFIKQGDHMQEMQDLQRGLSTGNNNYSDYQTNIKTQTFNDISFIDIAGDYTQLSLLNPKDYINIFNELQNILMRFTLNSNSRHCNNFLKPILKSAREEYGYHMFHFPKEIRFSKYDTPRQKIKKASEQKVYPTKIENLKKNDWIYTLYDSSKINIFENIVISESHIFFHNGIVQRQIEWFLPHLTNPIGIDIKITYLKSKIKNFAIKEFADLENYTMDDYRLFLSWSGYILFGLLPDIHYNSVQNLLQLVKHNRSNFILENFKDENIRLRKKWRESLIECQYNVTPFPKLFKETWIPKMKLEFGRSRGVDDAFFETFHIESKELSDRKNSYEYITKQSQIDFAVKSYYFLQNIKNINSSIFYFNPILFHDKTDSSNLTYINYNNYHFALENIVSFIIPMNTQLQFGKIIKIIKHYENNIYKTILITLELLLTQLNDWNYLIINEIETTNIETIQIEYFYLENIHIIEKIEDIQLINHLKLKFS